MREFVLGVYDTVIAIMDTSEQITAAGANQSELIGRTSIQKLTYLIQQASDAVELSEFTPYPYGPYSPTISLVMRELVSHVIIEESKISEKSHDNYRYKLTADGKSMAEDIQKNCKDIYEGIKKLVKKCHESCCLKTSPLSYAAKLHYITSKAEKEKITSDDLERRANALGWDLKDKDVSQGISVLKKLNLMEDELQINQQLR